MGWLKSYLTNRQQIVKIDDINSDIITLNCGVPQGSILGPLLFSIYTNDLYVALKHCKLIQFADDSTIYMTGHPVNTTHLINQDLETLMVWFAVNRLSLSDNKNSVIIFKNSEIQPCNLTIQINNHMPQIETHVKLLGIHLDSNLSWTTHLHHLRQKLSSANYALSRCKNFLNTPALKLIYYGLFHSHLTYGISLWGGSTCTNIRPLTILQKKAIRHIYHRSYREHTDPLFSYGNIMKIDDIHKIECIKIAFRLLNHKLPVNLQIFFQLNANVHQHNTRQTLVPHFNHMSSTKFKTSFIYHTATCWAGIPEVIRNNPNWNVVKNWSKSRLLSQ